MSAYHVPGHTNYHDISMLPPIGNEYGYWQQAHLHCKFHGACSLSGGTGLDWDNWTQLSNRYVYWNASFEWAVENVAVDLVVSGPYLQDPYVNCDYFTVNMYDMARAGVLIGTMKYTHSWSWYGDRYQIMIGPGNYIFWLGAGYMTGDADCGPNGQGGWWSGYHVHENSPNQQYTNSRYSGGTNGYYCDPNKYHNPDNCEKLWNFDRAAWTRSWHW